MINAATADLSSLASDLSYASNKGIEAAAQQVLQQSAQRVQDEARTRAPVRTGALKESITIRYVTPYKAVIGPQVDYGVYQEFGTGERGEFGGSAYTITPRRQGGVLRFQSNGKWVYSRKVRHPGIRARRYMRKGLEAGLGNQLAADLAAKGALLITKGPKA